MRRIYVTPHVLPPSDFPVLNGEGYLVDPEGRFLHRIIYANAHGKPPSGWEIHHIDFDRTNNILPNLIALPRYLHQQIHREMAEAQIRYDRPFLEDRLGKFTANVRELRAKRAVLVSELAGIEKALTRFESKDIVMGRYTRKQRRRARKAA